MIRLEPDRDVPPAGLLPLVTPLPGLVVGWQRLSLESELLVSAGGASWPPRSPRVASCPITRHVAPAAGCGCGIAVHSEEDLSTRATSGPDGRSVVVACVAGWGRGEGDPPGAPWRTKRGYPLFLICDHRSSIAERRRLGRRYGVPVFCTEPTTDTASLFRDRDRRVVLRTVRKELTDLLARHVADGVPVPERAAEGVVENVLATWSTATAWRLEHRPATGSTPISPTPPTPVPTPADQNVAVPDVAGIVVAWRSWNLRQDGLTSVTRPDPWPPRRSMVAQCDRAGHDTPRQSCSCGIYSARTIGHAGSYHALGGQPSVLGCVALWGQLVEGGLGYRAEKATPLVLFTPDTVSEPARRRLADRYGVPVHRVPGSDDWWSGGGVARAAEVLRSALESAHGRLGDDDVSAAVARVVAAGTVSAAGPPLRGDPMPSGYGTGSTRLPTGIAELAPTPPRPSSSVRTYPPAPNPTASRPRHRRLRVPLGLLAMAVLVVLVVVSLR